MVMFPLQQSAKREPTQRHGCCQIVDAAPGGAPGTTAILDPTLDLTRDPSVPTLDPSVPAAHR